MWSTQRVFRLMMVGLGMSVVLPAFADIYVCTDATGKKVYQNFGNSKGCKRLSIDANPTIPAPNLPNSTSEGVAKPASIPGYTGSAPSSPKDFPAVNAGQQFNRDQERRRIIEDELRNEERKLADLKKEYNNGEPERMGNERNYAKYQERAQRLQEDIRRAENNINALRRELSTIR